jgi:hypothetical protein
VLQATGLQQSANDEEEPGMTFAPNVTTEHKLTEKVLAEPGRVVSARQLTKQRLRGYVGISKPMVQAAFKTPRGPWGWGCREL